MEFNILHLASMARSGETLFLRTFSVHTDVSVVHDLYQENSEAEIRLYELIRSNEPARLHVDDLPFSTWVHGIKPTSRFLLIKQGAFSPRQKFHGIGLIRNPLSVFLSLWNYEAKLAGDSLDYSTNYRNWLEFRLPRLMQWAETMFGTDAALIAAKTTPEEQFLMFYKMRLQQIRENVATIIHYEDLTSQPEITIKLACDALGLEFQPHLLYANRFYPVGLIGHGGTDLGAAIRPDSKPSFPEGINSDSFLATVDEPDLERYRDMFVIALAES